MPILLTDAIRRIRADIDEPAYPTLPNSTALLNPQRQYTDTEITDWINDGLRDIARRAETLITADSTVQIPAYGENPHAPVPTYPLNLGTPPNNYGPVPNPTTYSDVIRINRVEFQVGGDSSQIYRLEAAQQNYLDQVWNIDQLSTMAYPSYWTTRGYPGGTGRNAFVIQIFPNASQAGQLNIFYYRLPLRILDPVADPANYNMPLDLIEGWDDIIVDYGHMRALIKARSEDWKIAQAMYEGKVVNIIDQTRQFHNQPQYMSYDTIGMGWGTDSWGGW